jgi:polysaccharide biosynthesis protein PslG
LRGVVIAGLALAGVLALVLVLVTSSSDETRKAPAGLTRTDQMFAVSVNRVFNDDFTPADRDTSLAAVRASGLRQARSDAFWMWAEPNPPANGEHSYDWERLDAEAGALAKHGLRWLPILDYSAPWAASVPSDYHSPPRSDDDYAAYARAFAERYGRGGSFWVEHPELDPVPVTDYEIWNEPNGHWAWRPRPDAARYADLYLKARAAIRAADPRATVVVGGLVAHAGFVAKLYAARPGLRGNVDAIGWHAYSKQVKGIVRGVRELRQTLRRLRQGGVPIHITELGWPTKGHFPIVIGEVARAISLENAAESLARSDCGVAAIVVYTWTSPERKPSDKEDWYGIIHPDGSPSPTGDAFARVVAHWHRKPVTDASRLELCGRG